jgi:chromosome partitioning protein
MIILIGSQKGGVGKSTLSTNLSALLASTGKDVVLVDADRQSTSANWVHDRNETNKASLACARQYDNIKKTITDFNNRYEFVIVDCQGRDSIELRTGLLAADICLIPCRPSQADLDTIPLMSVVINTAKEINENLKAYCVLTMSPTNPSITEIADSKDYLARHPSIKLLNTIISDRKVYRDAMSAGFGVTEMDNDKAKNEIESLLKEIMKW